MCTALKVNNGGSEKICFLAEGASRRTINKNLGDICDVNNIIPYTAPYDLTMKKLFVWSSAYLAPGLGVDDAEVLIYLGCLRRRWQSPVMTGS